MTSPEPKEPSFEEELGKAMDSAWIKHPDDDCSAHCVIDEFESGARWAMSLQAEDNERAQKLEMKRFTQLQVAVGALEDVAHPEDWNVDEFPPEVRYAVIIARHALEQIRSKEKP